MFLGGIEVIVPIHSEAVFEPSQHSDFILEKSPSSTYELKKIKVLSTLLLVMNFDFASRDSLPPLNGLSFLLQWKTEQHTQYYAGWNFIYR